MEKFVSQIKRSHYCGMLEESTANENVVLMGWVDTRRDHGSLVFIDLRDRSGFVQVVLDPSKAETARAKDLRGEFVIAVSGRVEKRPEGMVNKKISTGAIEIHAERLEILSQAETPPFQVDDQNVNEILRLKYRYLDLRSPRLQRHMRVRHEFNQIVRKTLTEENFYEIETPILYKSTPEGARDYLVPSRVHLGEFYALPQSPQTLKQLLMISGYDRYFQIARCFRDEDLRADRQPEFSQVDIEMSFIDQEDVLALTEKAIGKVWSKLKGVELGPIPRMTYQEAMDRYGNDKPDIRFGLEIVDLKNITQGSSFRVFEDAIARGGIVRGILYPGGGALTRGQLDKLTATAKQAGAKGLVWIKWEQGGKVSSPGSKFFNDDQLKEIVNRIGGQEGDAALVVADEYEVTCATLSTLRLQIGRENNLINTTQDRFLWVLDFPLLEYSPEDKRWAARHHPFTAPQDQDLEILLEKRDKEFGQLKAKAYDLVCNGYEIAGGSIRIHRSDVQQAMFETLGLSEDEILAKFGFFVEALKYGTPPHGGIAWGVDRIIMILCKTEAIRDVIAFPKTTKASDLMSSSPSPVHRDQLAELGIKLSATAVKSLETKDSEP